MKEAELKKVDFEECLEGSYEDIEPFLNKELEALRTKLIELPEDASEEHKMGLFKEAVENINDLENNDEVEGDIETDESEGLCDALYQMGTIVGLDEATDYLDKWREW